MKLHGISGNEAAIGFVAYFMLGIAAGLALSRILG